MGPRSSEGTSDYTAITVRVSPAYGGPARVVALFRDLLNTDTRPIPPPMLLCQAHLSRRPRSGYVLGHKLLTPYSITPPSHYHRVGCRATIIPPQSALPRNHLLLFSPPSLRPYIIPYRPLPAARQGNTMPLLLSPVRYFRRQPARLYQTANDESGSETGAELRGENENGEYPVQEAFPLPRKCGEGACSAQAGTARLPRDAAPPNGAPRNDLLQGNSSSNRCQICAPSYGAPRCRAALAGLSGERRRTAAGAPCSAMQTSAPPKSS
ncbi:hypothetical protein BV898_16282 [Hypsibius exemplaris]|uniref:Uncharacterized protein n=1 Tax=Hypsibius exemplaris TaxID=2072580 RepID=A0A9X6NLP4_HYPEX|nr:hypothetical protein BV898_16282 [Hypsibius exemplaris]